MQLVQPAARWPEFCSQPVHFLAAAPLLPQLNHLFQFPIPLVLLVGRRNGNNVNFWIVRRISFIIDRAAGEPNGEYGWGRGVVMKDGSPSGAQLSAVDAKFQDRIENKARIVKSKCSSRIRSNIGLLFGEVSGASSWNVVCLYFVDYFRTCSSSTSLILVDAVQLIIINVIGGGTNIDRGSVPKINHVVHIIQVCEIAGQLN